MDQGDVYHIQGLELPNRGRSNNGQYTALNKYVVLLQDPARFAGATDVTVLVASTLRVDKSELKAYEVLVGSAEGFDHDTVLDARWPYTLAQSVIRAQGSFKFQLPQAVMGKVSVALVRGLQLVNPSPMATKAQTTVPATASTVTATGALPGATGATSSTGAPKA